MLLAKSWLFGFYRGHVPTVLLDTHLYLDVQVWDNITQEQGQYSNGKNVLEVEKGF